MKSLTTYHSRILLIALLISFSISLSIVHTSINTLDENSLGGLVDSRAYVSSYYGEELHGHWRYRILTPGLARLVPDGVENLLLRDPTPYRRAHLHFAFVNLGFLTLTGVLFFDYLLLFVTEVWLAMLGITIYLTSRVNVQSGGAPMVDPAAFFFLLLGAWAILKRRPVWLLLAMTLGIFAKETTLLLWPLLGLADLPWRIKARNALLLIPGTIGYMLFRFVLFPDPVGESYFNLTALEGVLARFSTFFDSNSVVDWVSSFNLFWLPALYALWRVKKPIILIRWVWFVPLVIAMILLLDGNLGRILFLTFPVVIPLALLGMRAAIQPGAVGETKPAT